jgi:hypothetical protein
VERSQARTQSTAGVKLSDRGVQKWKVSSNNRHPTAPILRDALLGELILEKLIVKGYLSAFLSSLKASLHPQSELLAHLKCRAQPRLYSTSSH